MAGLWSIATLLCAVAGSYEQMLGARFLVGVGEAAYGSVGIAVVLSVFAPRLRASLSGAFMAGGSFGSVIGVVLGGVIAVQLSWRCVLRRDGDLRADPGRPVLDPGQRPQTRPLRHRRRRPTPPTPPPRRRGFRAPISSLFTNPAVLCAYIGGGLQMFTAAALMAWLPSFFGRSYGTRPRQGRRDRPRSFVLLIGAGMIVCGIITDRVARTDPTRKWTTAICLLPRVAGPASASGSASTSAPRS